MKLFKALFRFLFFSETDSDIIATCSSWLFVIIFLEMWFYFRSTGLQPYYLRLSSLIALAGIIMCLKRQKHWAVFYLYFILIAKPFPEVLAIKFLFVCWLMCVSNVDLPSENWVAYRYAYWAVLLFWALLAFFAIWQGAVHDYWSVWLPLIFIWFNIFLFMRNYRRDLDTEKN